MNLALIKNACTQFYLSLCDLLGAIYRDILAIYLVLKVETKISRYIKKDIVLADIFRKLVKKHPNKPCIIFNKQIWTFQDVIFKKYSNNKKMFMFLMHSFIALKVENYSNKIANLFLNEYKLKKGDCVALFLENKPEYVAIWIGLSKIGVISSLVNTNLKNQPLLHSFQASKPKCIIYSSSLEESMDTIQNELDKNIPLIFEGNKSAFVDSICLNDLLKKTTSDIVQPSEKIRPNDPIM